MWQDITEKYFNDVRNYVSSLTSFVRMMGKQDGVMDEARRTYHSIIGSRNELNPLLLFDIGICCKALGKGLDFSKKESLVFYLSLINEKTRCTLDSVQDPEILRLAQNLAHSIETSVDGIDPERCSFLIETVLRNAESDWLAKYLSMMNAVSNIIAKADDTVTEEEARWLSYRFGNNKERQDPLLDIEVKYWPTKPTQIQTEDKLVEKTEEAIALQKALHELDRLIGLREVKDEIHSLVNFAETQRKRRQLGLKPLQVSMHCVFTGNPGTGKTTVARILGKIYHGMGLLKSDKVVEVDRSALVGGFVGQTAIKTNEVIDEALGGVLFIDEAYSLANRGQNDFGHEVISTLIKRMEDDRDNLVVILAGYSSEMETFLDSNPGLRSRFNKYIHFDDYSAKELSDILALMLKDNDYRMTDGAWEIMHDVFAKAVSDKTQSDRASDFGNGRYVRNLFERLLQNQANRVAYLPSVSKEILSTIEDEDAIEL